MKTNNLSKSLFMQQTSSDLEPVVSDSFYELLEMPTAIGLFAS